MTLSAKGLQFIPAEEGTRYQPYLDVGGKWTVGVGHLMSDADLVKWPPGSTLTQVEVLQLLASDVEQAEKAVNQLVTVPLSQSQFDALVDFVFNLGAGSLERSTLLEDLNEGNYNAAAAQIPLWDHAGGRVVKDLEERRLAEQRLFFQESA